MKSSVEILLSCAPELRIGSVVQLVRMPPCHGGGRGFESRPVRLDSSITRSGGWFCIFYSIFYSISNDLTRFFTCLHMTFVNLRKKNVSYGLERITSGIFSGKKLQMER
jgi:hypothetical protein